jgi:hypothetical protein
MSLASGPPILSLLLLARSGMVATFLLPTSWHGVLWWHCAGRVVHLLSYVARGHSASRGLCPSACYPGEASCCRSMKRVVVPRMLPSLLAVIALILTS